MSGGVVLIVEDHEMLRKVLRISLEGGGFSVAEAATGAEAMQLLDAARPDLIITDLGLPDIDGVELLDRIRSTPAGADLPVVALSGADEGLERARSADGSFAECLIKPVSPDDLLELVERHLSAATAPQLRDPNLA